MEIYFLTKETLQQQQQGRGNNILKDTIFYKYTLLLQLRESYSLSSNVCQDIEQSCHHVFQTR